MILVTGGSGFLGTHFIRAISERSPAESIKAFDMDPPRSALPDGVDFMAGSIGDRGALARAAIGARTVVHLAAKVEPDSRDYDDMHRVNVVGTQNVCHAAIESGCQLFLHVSSAGVYGPPRQAEPFGEDDPLMPESPYQQTKRAAEEFLQSVDPGQTTINILRPAGIYASGSHLELPLYRTLARRKLVVELKGGVLVQPTHVTDVVGALLAVIDGPAPHKSTFNVGGERPILVQDLHMLIAAALGVRRRRVVLAPAAAARAAKLAGPILSRMGRPIPNLLSFSRGDVLSAAVDDTRFRDRYPTVPILPLSRGIDDHVQWARQHGLL